MNLNKHRILIISVSLLVIATFVGMIYINSHPGKRPETTASAKQFVCSMHPQVVQDGPGDCPICGMFLIEKIENDRNKVDSSLNDVVCQVNESVLAAVATITPQRSNLPLIVESTGVVTLDARKIRIVSAQFPGVIEKSFIKYKFQHVKKGEKIYQVYCPDIYTERWNYIKLLQAFPDKDNLTTEARDWLTLLGLTKGQIDSLKRAPKPDYHLFVYSDMDGYAIGTEFDPDNYFSPEKGDSENYTELLPGTNGVGITEGQTIETGTPLFKLVDANSLRIDLQIRTEDVSLLRVGQKVVLTDPSIPEIKISSVISQIDPINGGLFQLVKIYYRDTKGILTAGRPIRGEIIVGEHEALWLPGSAIADLGKRSSVFLLRDGKFVATTITTGMRSGEKIEVLSGISPDSEIAQNAFMLIDSDGFISTKPESDPINPR